jgi:hypothetical protein
MARTKPAPAPSPDDAVIGAATPTEPLPVIPESASPPDAKPLEEATELVKAAEAEVAALSDEDKAKLAELGAQVVPPDARDADAPDAPPPPPEPFAPPQDQPEVECERGHLKGSAKVWEHGSLNFDGTLHPPGTVLLLCPCDLSDDDAKKLVELGVLIDPHAHA